MTKSLKTDFLIIGGGVVGLTIAHELSESFPAARIDLIEKERDVALHASGRNSGVIHAGFYYHADSHKAHFCVEGNKLLKQFCRRHGLVLNECGKWVVATNEAEADRMEELFRRAVINNVYVERKPASKVPGNIQTMESALWSPSTASIDPVQVCQTLKSILHQRNVTFHFNTLVTDVLDGVIRTQTIYLEPQLTINAAGAYADRIARLFGVIHPYTMIPFKGLYLIHDGSDDAIQSHIYPVPDIRNPFLGVHFTATADGRLKIGPTAIPALWREHYSGFDRFQLNEFSELIYHGSRLWWKNPFDFRRLAFEEVLKYIKPVLRRQATKLVPDMDVSAFQRWARPGIRAQLVNTKTLELEEDFIFHEQSDAMHILNAVSPAFTGAFAMARHIVQRITA